MLNGLSLAIIIGVVVVGLFVTYIIVKRKSGLSTDTLHPETNQEIDVPVVEPETVIPEIVQTSVETVTIAPEVVKTDNRRKYDSVSPKRSVPPHIKVTKSNFAEYSGERILIAEDNLINQKVIMGLLGDSGIELVMANDGQEALDILEHDSNFIMILMDVNMPRLDGLQATRIIRENPKYVHILIVALSGDIATDDIQKMKDAGMSEQLAKPLRIDALYNIIYAYTGDKTSDTSPSSHAITALDVEKGRETCGGDESLYREILSEFIDDYGNSAFALGEMLRSNDLHGADALLLDISGVCESIDAHQLAQIALSLKLSFTDTSEQSYFTLFDEYRLNSDKLMEEIRQYLAA